MTDLDFLATLPGSFRICVAAAAMKQQKCGAHRCPVDSDLILTELFARRLSNWLLQVFNRLAASVRRSEASGCF